MSNPGVPVGQLAYQAIFATKYQNAVRCFQQTANRYGGGSLVFNSLANSTNPVCAYPVGSSRRRRFALMGGQVAAEAAVITSAGATGFVVNDTVTFAPVNGGRSIVVKVTAVTAGNPTAVTVLDQGGGISAGANGQNNLAGEIPANLVLTQQSTSGVGVTGVWTLQGFGMAFGWVYPMPNPLG
jgi:hypothetical protein